MIFVKEYLYLIRCDYQSHRIFVSAVCNKMLSVCLRRVRCLSSHRSRGSTPITHNFLLNFNVPALRLWIYKLRYFNGQIICPYKIQILLCGRDGYHPPDHILSGRCWHRPLRIIRQISDIRQQTIRQYKTIKPTKNARFKKIPNLAFFNTYFIP